MRTIVYTKNEIMSYCENKLSEIKDFYSDYINEIEHNHGKAHLTLFFYDKGKFYKNPRFPKGIIKLCVMMFPENYSVNTATKNKLCQKFYSNIGKFKRNDKDGYYLQIDKHEDLSLTAFIKSKALRLQRYDAGTALKENFSDLLRAVVHFRRYGSDFKRTYRKFNLAWILIVIIILIFILRIITPRYHPSLK